MCLSPSQTLSAYALSGTTKIGADIDSARKSTPRIREERSLKSSSAQELPQASCMFHYFHAMPTLPIHRGNDANALLSSVSFPKDSVSTLEAGPHVLAVEENGEVRTQ